jgi:predicted RNase H-like HicB family nuclease
MAGAYQVELERDEDRWWLARVPRVPGVHSQGRSIQQTLDRVREALSLWVNDATTADLEPEIHLPLASRRTVDRALAARKRAERAGEEASLVTLEAVSELAHGRAMSVRDIAALLQLSAARVSQLELEAER